MTKFAIIETGGKQYKVSEGNIIKIEKLPNEHKQGDKIVFDKTLLTSNEKDAKIGAPYLENVKVTAEFVEEGRGKKIRIMRFKPKSNYLKRMGHRQTYQQIKIVKI
ncbi:MAG: 50S ribosomal protein L21 [Candidatus Pacebacteria bacterium]|nr:50S ribosomal protein L21 [Candidatus Paceibacterota bacterium]